jgi:asparagine synthase (glutamine-hydrolysing)
LSLPGFKKGVEEEAVRSFLTYGYIAGEKSIWKGVKRLMPGCMGEYDVSSNSFQVSNYWSIDCSDRIDSSEAAFGQFEELFSDIIEDHLVSDVPLGVFLSGGIDSSSISAAAREYQAELQSFSIGFKGSEIDELPVARKTAQLLDLKHREFVIDPQKRSELMNVFAFMDEPLADTSIFPTYLVSKEARRYVKVALSGDGGDELLGGYTWYFQTEDARRIKRFMFLLGRILGPAVTHRHRHLKRLDEYQHYLMLNAPGFTNQEIKRLFPAMTSEKLLHSETYLYRSYSNADCRSYKRWQYIDFHTYLVENNLLKDDRLSMANSLEVRVPLLDHRLVELAFSLTHNVNIHNRQGKQLLRRYLDKAGLQHVLSWPKKGFSFDVTSIWPINDMIAMLRQGGLMSDQVIDSRAMETLFARDRRNQNQYRIWLLAVLEVWYSRWFLGVESELQA